MTSGEGTPARRLRLVPGRLVRLTQPPAARRSETPRVEALDALLREVDDLRLTLETDLTLAASAVESGEPGIAADILGADRTALHAFEEHALDHLNELDSPRRARAWAHLHAAPIVAAAALVGVMVGVVPQTLGPGAEPSPHSVAAADTLGRLQESAESGDADDVRAASVQLHRQLAGILANVDADPAAARNALLLLTYEQSAIVRSGDSGALADVLRQSRALAAAIVAALPASQRRSVPELFVAPEPSSSPAAKPTPSAKPAQKPSASPAATASPSPTSSPSPTREGEPYPLPSAPSAP